MKGFAVKRTTIGRITSTVCLVGIAGLTLSSPTWASKFYKWVDDEGTTHYSAQPPREKPSQQVNINVNRSSDANQEASTQPATQAQQPDQGQQMSDAERVAEIERRNREVIAKNCEIMRRNLETLTQHARVRTKGEDGQITVLAEEERQQRIKKAQDYINANCN